MKRHTTSFAHTKGIPCHLCKKYFSRTDDLSLHLQKLHQLSFKDAGRKSGSLRRKTKRKNRNNEELDEMAAEIERALLNPSKKLITPQKVVASLTVPKDTPFTISAPAPPHLVDLKTWKTLSLAHQEVPLYLLATPLLIATLWKPSATMALMPMPLVLAPYCQYKTFN